MANESLKITMKVLQQWISSLQAVYKCEFNDKQDQIPLNCHKIQLTNTLIHACVQFEYTKNNIIDIM